MTWNLKTMGLSAVALFAALAFAQPQKAAAADRDDWRCNRGYNNGYVYGYGDRYDAWREHEYRERLERERRWREREWREHEWREHERREHERPRWDGYGYGWRR